MSVEHRDEPGSMKTRSWRATITRELVKMVMMDIGL